MKKEIHIIKRVRKPSFREKLEDRARGRILGIERVPWDSSPRGFIQRQLALTLNHIGRVRKLNDELVLRLLRMECYTDTELIHMEQRTPRYSPYRFPEREKLQRRLIKIEDERRKLAIAKEEKLQQLHDRLLDLMNKDGQINQNYGNRKDSKEA